MSEKGQAVLVLLLSFITHISLILWVIDLSERQNGAASFLISVVGYLLAVLSGKAVGKYL